MKIVISGSSFLLPKNKAWQALSDNNTLEFASYGNWANSLISVDQNDALAIVLFLDDLIDLGTKQESDVNNLIGSLINLLERRLSKGKAPTLVCFASGDDSHVVASARTPSVKYVVHQQFFGEAYSLAGRYPHLYLIDLDRLFGFIGQKLSLDTRNWYLAHCRVSKGGLEIIANAIRKVLNRNQYPAAKVLILDCDNTLWGGIVGEDGIAGLVLGQDGLGLAYVNFQVVAKKIAQQGVILALASKNNEAEVWQVFEQHSSMVLSRTDIVAWKINWQEKAQSIRDLAIELDLGLDSIVFWDDNPIERGKVRDALPEVLTVEVNGDVFEWPNQLAKLDCFAKFAVTSEDRKKTNHYHSRAKFLRDKISKNDEVSYLKTIQLQPDSLGINQLNISRAVQLCEKTNQYNLRTMRYKAEELFELSKRNPDCCFLTKLSDVYGDHGIVGLVCMRALDAETIFLDTLLMSCRVLGRYLETWMLMHGLTVAKMHGYINLVGEFIPNQRNKVAESFFESHGFAPLIKHAQLGSMSPEIWETISQHSTISHSRLYVISTKNTSFRHQEIYEKNRNR